MTSQVQTSTGASNSDFTVDITTGEAFISQTKAAAELGIARSSLQKWLIKEQVEYDVKQGLSSEILALAAGYYALDSMAATLEAKELLRKISLAGAKAYLYHEAGYVIQAVPIQPKSPVELARENVAQAQAMLTLIENQEKMKLELVTKQEIIDQKLIVTNENPEYRTVATMRKLDPDGIYDGNLLTRKRIEMKLPHAQLYAPDGYPTVNTYHLNVWKSTYPHLDF